MSAIVFDDHRFCAGRSLLVEVMPAPHTHSQVEMNLIVEGHMDYRSTTVRRCGCRQESSFCSGGPSRIRWSARPM